FATANANNGGGVKLFHVSSFELCSWGRRREFQGLAGPTLLSEGFCSWNDATLGRSCMDDDAGRGSCRPAPEYQNKTEASMHYIIQLLAAILIGTAIGAVLSQ